MRKCRPDILRTASDGKERAHYASGVVRRMADMVNLLRSRSLIRFNLVTMDVGLEEPTTLNDYLCFGCYRYFGDNMIDVASGLCLLCVRVAPDEGEEDDEYEPNPLMD